MSKIDWTQKLSSRKLWAASVVACVLAEGKADTARAGKGREGGNGNG